MQAIRQVQQHVDGDVLVIEIDNPPVNAGSAAVRQGILDAVARLASDPSLKAGVVIGAGSTFIAGSDLREFGQPLTEPQLPRVIAAIEDCPKPVVAALHGQALGGGFELALGCDSRIAAVGTAMGLPEVTLGMIPGAGGTQRLPRIVGLPRAIGMICSGERVPAQAALELGLIDELVPDAPSLRAAAIGRARALPAKLRLRDRAARTSGDAEIEAAANIAIRAGKARPAVTEAIAAVRSATTLQIDEALAREREVFQRLRMSEEALALRHLFFAEREAGRVPAGIAASARAVRSIAVIGAGTMGAGIAIALLTAGLGVVLLEQDREALERGLARVREFFRARVDGGKMKAAAAAASEARLKGTTEWPDITEADAVIEAVFEDLSVKREVFAKIVRYASRGALLATNTSYLSIDAIGGDTPSPDFLGLHFFSPAQVMKLLEVVRGSRTSDQAVATAMALGRKLGKTPVLCRDSMGFIGNRIYNAYRTQCEYLLEDGAWPEEVDDAMESFGMAMGPFAVADLSGLDIAWRMRMRRAQAGARDPRQRYVPVLDWLCESGRTGQKAGAGYYAYPEGRRERTTDQEVRRLIERSSAERGVERRRIEPAEVERRVLLAMVNEAALLFSEQVAQRPGDIDVVLVQGYGFPRWKGGPVFWARQQDRDALAADISALAAASGPNAAAASPKVLGRLLDQTN